MELSNFVSHPALKKQQQQQKTFGLFLAVKQSSRLFHNALKFLAWALEWFWKKKMKESWLKCKDLQESIGGKKRLVYSFLWNKVLVCFTMH